MPSIWLWSTFICNSNSVSEIVLRSWRILDSSCGGKFNTFSVSGHSNELIHRSGCGKSAARGSPGKNGAETKSDRDKNWTIKLSPAIIQFEVWKLRDKSSGHWHVPTGRKDFLQKNLNHYKTNSFTQTRILSPRCAYEQLWLSVECSLLVVFYFNQMVSGFSLSPAHLLPLVNDSWLLWECFTMGNLRNIPVEMSPFLNFT